MNSKNRQNKKRHIGRRLLALLVCLLTIMPMVGSALPEFTDMVGGIAESLGFDKRPDAGSYSEGAKYLDDFLKEHPDATVFGRGDDIYGKDQARPTSAGTPTVGTPGDRIDPDWFKAIVNVMGVLKAQGYFSLTPTDRTDGNPNNFESLWNALADKELYINYPEEKQQDGSIGRYTSTETDKSTWPISGFMNWVTVGDYQYIDGGNYPELSTTYGERDVDYGITSAYLGTSRVYNAGVIAAENDKYLWVSIAEDGADDSVIVLPEPTPNQNITLHFGPREYPVSYQLMITDLDGKTYPLVGEDGSRIVTATGTREVVTETVVRDANGYPQLAPASAKDWHFATTTTKTTETIYTAKDNEGNELVSDNTLLALWGTPDVDAVTRAVLGTEYDTVTSNQTAKFSVTIPYGTYGDVTLVTANESTPTPVYPSSSGYGKNRLGAEPTYEFEYDSDEKESSSAIVGKPGRFSLSEPYSLGETGSVSGAATVTVTVTRRSGTYSSTNVNGYQVHSEHLEELFTGNRGLQTATNKIYYQWTNNHYDDPEDNGDGSYDAMIMFSADDNNSTSNRINLLEINEQEVALPDTSGTAASTTEGWRRSEETTLDDGSVVVVYYLLMHTGSSPYLGVNQIENFFNNGTYYRAKNITTNNVSGSITYGKDQSYDTVTLSGRPYPNMGTISETSHASVYVITVKNAKQDINITGGSVGSSKSDSSHVGKLYVEEANGVNVQLWYYNRYSSRGNRQTQRWWATYNEGSWIRIRWHHSTPDQHGKFRFYSAGYGVTSGSSNYAYQKYNVRLSLKNGYYWPGSDRDGNFLDENGNEIVTIQGYGQGLFEYDKTKSEEVVLEKYRSELKVNSSYTYSNLENGGDLVLSGYAGESTFTLKLDGSYSAFLKRDNSDNTNNYGTYTGKYEYDGETLTIYDTDNETVLFELTGDPMTFTYHKDSGNRYYESKFSTTPEQLEDWLAAPATWYYASLTSLPQLTRDAGKEAYLYFNAVARTYELNYLTGVEMVDGNSQGIGPNGEYDGRLPGINVRSATMPYPKTDDDNKITYIDPTKYSKADGKDKETGKYYVGSFHIDRNIPEDTPSDKGAAYKFQYWVLTDANGNPIDETGKVIVKGADETVAEWQAKFITFYPSDSISLSTFDSLLTATKTEPENGEKVKEEDYTIEFDKGNQKFKFYLTACWTPDVAEPFTNYVTVNSRADVENGETNTVTRFEGDWYEVASGEKLTGEPAADALANYIKAAYSYTSFLDKEEAGIVDETDGKVITTITVNKDKLIEYMGKYAQTPGQEKYKWYTFDTAQNGWNEERILNGSYIWQSVKDKDEVPVWFRDSLGGVKINTDINGYDQPLPYKLTFTLPTYEGDDRMPTDFAEDGRVTAWDETDYRYTFGNEAEFFGTDGNYSVAIRLETGTHEGETSGTVFKNTDYKAMDDDGNYLFLTSTSGGTVKVENYLGNEDVLDVTDTTTKLILTQDKKDPQTYYAIIYLGKGDSITIPALPEKTTYGLALYNEVPHPDFDPKDNPSNPSYVNRHKYDGYEMENAKKNEDETSTIWTETAMPAPTGVPMLDGDHNASKGYFDVTFTEKDEKNKTYGSFTSADFEKDGKTYKGINAYDTQVIDVTSKGMYTIYLDQYTTVEVKNTDTMDEEELDQWTAGDLLQAQNFNYLSYISTARNLTNEHQTLTITLAVDSLIAGSEEKADRLLAVVMINNQKQDEWNPDDKDPGVEGEETEGDDLADVTFSNGEKGKASWAYDYYTHAVTYTVTNVPAGESITLTARNTVPAVNTATSYVATASLSVKSDPEYSLADDPVQADVFSYWLRVAAFIGGANYTLTSTDEQQVFTYEVTLSNPTDVTPDQAPIKQDNVIKYMLYTSSADFSTEKGTLKQVPIDSLNSDGSFTFTIEGVDEEGNTLESLKHDWRIVIYEIFDPDETTEDEYDGTSDPLNGIGYKVAWVPKNDAQKEAYSVYLNAYDGGETNGYPGQFIYDGGHIGEGIDMVVYRYMPSNSLTVSKEVQGDQTTEWEFTIKLTNKDLNELDSRFDVGYGGTTVWADEQKVKPSDWKKETVTKEDGTTVTYVTLTVTLKHGQNIIIYGLPQGTEYIVSERAKVSGLVFTPSYVITGGEVKSNGDGTYTAIEKTEEGETTATGSIYVNQKYKNGTDPETGEDVWENVIEGGAEKRAANVVAFTNSMSGDLTIKKVVPNYNNKEADRAFKFNVTLTDANGATVSGTYKDDAGNEVTFENGKATVTISISNGTVDDGTWSGSVTIKALPNGTHYEVAEIVEYGTDYVPRYENETGSISGDGSTVTCTNEKTGTLTVQKEVVRENGSTTDTGSRIDAFTFTVTLKNAAGLAESYTAKFIKMGDETELTTNTVDWEEKDGALVGTFTLAHGQQVSIVGLPAGTTYTIVEADEGNYTTKITVDGSETAKEDKTTDEGVVKLWSDNGGTVVHYENSREGTTPSGIMMAFAWMIPLFLLAIGGVTAIMIKRRRRAAL